MKPGPISLLAKLGSLRREFLLRYFRPNPVLADAGETLLDEYRVIQLRRRILTAVDAAQRQPNSETIPRQDEVRPVAPPTPLECCLPETDEVGINRSILMDSAERFAPYQSTSEEAEAGERRKNMSRSRFDNYYNSAHDMSDLSALCLSGGGIRSAAFALGVVQGLAKRDLLQRFDYLSTVSGGGYLGGFLTAWVQRSRSLRQS
jgi:hypothetical protein